jgi:hypothetical protein
VWIAVTDPMAHTAFLIVTNNNILQRIKDLELTDCEIELAAGGLGVCARSWQ